MIFIGSLMITSVVALALFSSKSITFLNLHALALVVGGSVGIFLVSNSVETAKSLVKSILKSRQKPELALNLKSQLVKLSNQKNADITGGHHLLKYGQNLWLQGIESALFKTMLSQYLTDIHNKRGQAVHSLRNLAKYPPALGMTGTVIGMVTLFSELGSGQSNQIGPSLALAMVATFYGLILANMILMPLADRLQLSSLTELQENEKIAQLLLMIQDGQPAFVIEERFYEDTAA